MYGCDRIIGGIRFYTAAELAFSNTLSAKLCRIRQMAEIFWVTL